MTDRKEYAPIDMDAVKREELLWQPTARLRWYRPKHGSDNDIRLEQMYERVTGECAWRPVQILLED